jgi:hypothetical protein
MTILARVLIAVERQDGCVKKISATGIDIEPVKMIH